MANAFEKAMSDGMIFEPSADSVENVLSKLFNHGPLPLGGRALQWS